MIQKLWFKILIWIISSSFFFLASSIIISVFSPEPSEQQVMAFMEGMMNAMENSLMGLSMTIEQDVKLNHFILNATSMTIPLLIIGIIGGDFVRFLRGKDND